MNTSIVFGTIASVFCICIFLAWFFSNKARHQERMMMIEKGMNPDETGNTASHSRSVLFKLGIIIIGLSIGVLIIGLLVQFDALGKSDAIPMSILGICGGVAMVIANRLSAPNK